MKKRILIIGACGQIGTELTLKLRKINGEKAVIAADIRKGSKELTKSGPFEIVNAMDYDSILKTIEKYKVTDVYLMAAMLSATGEKYPDKAWELNMNSLFNVLNLAKEGKIKKLFWPSSIAVFGPTTPKENTPQETVMEPSTVYGISKQAGERWCEYYFNKYNVDVRSLRYPGIISWKTNPGGGTTDYAIEIFHKAILKGTYTSFLNKNSKLPMMYMDDAIDATIKIMDTAAEKVKIRSSYNLAAISFTPEEIANEIKTKIPAFKIKYHSDFRQAIADSWPKSIDDSRARSDWDWQHKYNLKKISQTMLDNLILKYKSE
ncbi:MULTISPECIES: NAD-dependent epimerase/dehydratase family protein [Flavobacteriaceae]|uniref:NAD-dependent epimerase/dehydratase family protein n=2 Tax=Flavobacteriaceae TaxID=49546 RepID=A0A4Y8ASN1_9FLAO|nr:MULTISPECIES: NAD-dependent epimerase/dehydratase family protein [Flavobacteriaceae]TEW74887.1 NAD-dependent epimerase/dehydratase family protein [Gramella jeungdoensis]GGK43235.1 L-threonine 3-dehydrogenase [Lutibacter litoralis]